MRKCKFLKKIDCCENFTSANLRGLKMPHFTIMSSFHETAVPQNIEKNVACVIHDFIQKILTH